MPGGSDMAFFDGYWIGSEALHHEVGLVPDHGFFEPAWIRGRAAAHVRCLTHTGGE